MLKFAGIEPDITDIKITKQFGRQIHWDRFYGKPLKKILHTMAQQDHITKPVSFLDWEDFLAPQDFLDGENIRGLYEHARNKDMLPMLYLFKKAGIKPTQEDIRIGLTKHLQVPWPHLEGDGLAEFYKMLQKLK